MPENEKKEEEAQETQQTEGTPETLVAIKAELEEEKKAKAAAEAALATRDTRIAELEASLNVVSQASETAAAELGQAKEAHSKAVTKYLDMARALNSPIPPDVITGGTIDEIDASVAKVKAIADSVKKALEAQAREAKVPAGAPPRGEISLEALSPKEKIAAGLQQGSQR